MQPSERRGGGVNVDDLSSEDRADRQFAHARQFCCCLYKLGQPSNDVQCWPTSAAASQDLAGQVRVLGLWSGPEFDNFVTVKSVWEKTTGGAVDWQGTQDLAHALEADDQAGTPPTSLCCRIWP